MKLYALCDFEAESSAASPVLPCWTFFKDSSSLFYGGVVVLTRDPLTCRSYIYHNESLGTRVGPLSSHCKSLRLGILTNNCETTIETSYLVNGQVLASLTRPVVEYCTLLVTMMDNVSWRQARRLPTMATRAFNR